MEANSESQWTLEKMVATIAFYPNLGKLKDAVKTDPAVEDLLRILFEERGYSPNDTFNSLEKSAKQGDDIVFALNTLLATAGIKKQISEGAWEILN